MHQTLNIEESFPRLTEIGQSLVSCLNQDPENSPEVVHTQLLSAYEDFRKHFIAYSLPILRPLLGDQYSKIVLYEETTAFGRLAFDWIQFGHNQPTGLHLHSDFVFEELFSGKVQEEVYEESPFSGEFEKVFEEVRGAPCSRFGYDPKGHPHCVTALAPKTWGLCLHLGHRGVVFVNPSEVAS